MYPFGVVEAHRDAFPECHLPDVRTARYNPLEFIRDDEGLAVRDINVPLDALPTPPRAYDMRVLLDAQWLRKPTQALGRT